VASCVATTDRSAADAGSIQRIRGIENQLSLALARTDVDALSKLWAEDFVPTMADGHVMTGNNRLASLRAKDGPTAASTLSNRNGHIDIRLFGDWAVVLVTSSWFEGERAVGSPYQATHVWAKRRDQWRLVSAHISEVRQ